MAEGTSRLFEAGGHRVGEIVVEGRGGAGS